MKASVKRIGGCVQDIPGIGSLYNVNLSQVVDSVYRLCAQAKIWGMFKCGG